MGVDAEGTPQSEAYEEADSPARSSARREVTGGNAGYSAAAEDGDAKESHSEQVEFDVAGRSSRREVVNQLVQQIIESLVREEAHFISQLCANDTINMIIDELGEKSEESSPGRSAHGNKKLRQEQSGCGRNVLL